MPVFQGNTTGSIKSSALNVPSTIKSFSLTNKSGGAITVSVYIATSDSTNRAIIPVSVPLAAGEAYISDTERKVLSNYYILIVTSGSLDYYFSIDE